MGLGIQHDNGIGISRILRLTLNGEGLQSSGVVSGVIYGGRIWK